MYAYMCMCGGLVVMYINLYVCIYMCIALPYLRVLYEATNTCVIACRVTACRQAAHGVGQQSRKAGCGPMQMK